MADRNNSGVLFKNDRKTKDSHPDYKGSITIGGTEYWVSGWKKVCGPHTKTPGEVFLSLAIESKETRNTGKKQYDDSFDDNIPF